jgi:hypothetical protein
MDVANRVEPDDALDREGEHGGAIRLGRLLGTYAPSSEEGESHEEQSRAVARESVA